MTEWRWVENPPCAITRRTNIPVVRSTVASGGKPAAAPGEQRTTINRALVEPESIEAARAEYDLLHAEILDIQGQFAARKAVWHEEGPDRVEWMRWRGAAATALRAKEGRYGFLKRWLQQREDSGGRDYVKGLLADVVTVLAEPTSDDARLALQRLVEWQQRWLDGPTDSRDARDNRA